MQQQHNIDTNLFRYHRERNECVGVFPYSFNRPMLCPGCKGRYQGSRVTQMRRRFRDWLLTP